MKKLYINMSRPTIPAETKEALIKQYFLLPTQQSWHSLLW